MFTYFFTSIIESHIQTRHFNYDINTFSMRSKPVHVSKIETECKRSLKSAYNFSCVAVDHDRVIRRIRFLLLTVQMTYEIVWMSRVLRNCIFCWRCTFMLCFLCKPMGSSIVNAWCVIISLRLDGILLLTYKVWIYTYIF